jgi:hypothetical protein
MEGLTKLALEIQANDGAADEFSICDDLARQSSLSAAAILPGFAIPNFFCNFKNIKSLTPLLVLFLSFFSS